jgi:hypothetical protein
MKPPAALLLLPLLLLAARRVPVAHLHDASLWVATASGLVQGEATCGSARPAHRHKPDTTSLAGCCVPMIVPSNC